MITPYNITYKVSTIGNKEDDFIYTLSDFLLDNPVPEIQLLTKPFDFSKVQIDSISVIELPVDDFVKKNDLVLSTAIGCLDDEITFKQFIKEIKNLEASVLLLSFKDLSYSITDNVIKFADEIGLPIFSIPWEYRFAALSDFVIKKIHNKNIEIYKEVQDKLFNAYFDSQSLNDAADIISEFLDVPIEIINKNRSLKGKCKKKSDGSEENYLEIEICINNFPSGYLLVYNADKCETLISDKNLIEKYVNLPLSLWFNKESIENMVVIRLKNDFVWNLANKNYNSFNEMAEQGIKLGFNLVRPYTCVVFKVIPKNASTSASVQEYSQEAAIHTSEIESIVISEGNLRHLSIMLADRSLMFVVYIENPSNNSKNVIENFIDHLETVLQNSFPKFEFYWGVSETTKDTANFDLLYRNASLALHYCINSKNKKYRFTYKDTKIFQIISDLSDNPAIRKMAESALEKILEFDKTSDMDLMKTITEFINSNYNTSQTARNLHLHRQSLLYRLEKIEKLTNISLDNHKDLFLLEVFTRIFVDY